MVSVAGRNNIFFAPFPRTPGGPLSQRTQSQNTQENAFALDDGLLAMALALTLMMGLRFVDYAYDDAYITYRYARNLSLGHGLVYNLGQDFLGTTTPLYSVLLALVSPLISIPTASGLISLLSLLGALVFCEILGRQAGIRFAGSTAAIFLAAEPQIYHIFGGETLFVYFLLLPAGLALHQAGRSRTAALLFGLAILGRMDAILFVGLVYLREVIQYRRLPLAEGAWIACLLVPWFVYSFLVFGQFFPATLETKMAMGESGAWKLFFPGSQSYLSALIPYQTGAGALFVSMLLLGLWRVIQTERIWLFFIVTSFLFALTYQWVLASAFSHWYLASLYLSHALLLGAGLRQTLKLLAAFEQRIAIAEKPLLRTPLRLGLTLLVGLCLASGAKKAAQFDIQPPRRQLYTEVGRWLEANTRRDESVAYFEIGYLGWFSQRNIVDPVGLVTPGGLDSIRQGQLHWIFGLHSPNYFIHNSRRGQDDPLLSSQAFRARYEEIERFRADDYPGELVVFKQRRG